MGPSRAHPGPIWGPTLPNWGPTGAHMECCLGAHGSSASRRTRRDSSSSEQPEGLGGSSLISHSGRDATRRGRPAHKPGPLVSPKRPPRKLELSPRRSPRLANTGVIESARRLPLTAKRGQERVAHASTSEDEQSALEQIFVQRQRAGTSCQVDASPGPGS